MKYNISALFITLLLSAFSVSADPIEGRDEIAFNFTQNGIRYAWVQDGREVCGININWLNQAERIYIEDQQGFQHDVESVAALNNMLIQDKVVFENIFFNIDLVVYPANRSTDLLSINYEFIVYPMGNPADIKMIYEGSKKAGAMRGGVIQFENLLGNLQVNAPYAYQDNALGSYDQVKLGYHFKNQVFSISGANYEQGNVLKIAVKHELSSLKAKKVPAVYEEIRLSSNINE